MFSSLGSSMVDDIHPISDLDYLRTLSSEIEKHRPGRQVRCGPEEAVLKCKDGLTIWFFPSCCGVNCFADVPLDEAKHLADDLLMCEKMWRRGTPTEGMGNV